MSKYTLIFFFKQKTAYEIVSRDWSSDVCSSDLPQSAVVGGGSSNSVTQGQHGLNNPSPSDSPLSKVCNKLSVFIYFLHMLYCSLLFLVRFIIETLFLRMYGNVVVEHTEIP